MMIHASSAYVTYWSKYTHLAGAPAKAIDVIQKL